MKGLTSGLPVSGGAVALLLLAGCAPRLGPPAPVEYLAGAAPVVTAAARPPATPYGAGRPAAPAAASPSPARPVAGWPLPPQQQTAGTRPPWSAMPVTAAAARPAAALPPVQVATALPYRPLVPPHPLPPATTQSLPSRPSWSAALVATATGRPPPPLPASSSVTEARIAPPPAAVPPAAPHLAGWSPPPRQPLAAALPPRPPPQAEPAALPAEAKPAAPPATPSPVVATLPPPTLPPLADTSFVWPVRGRILSSFGPGPDGTRNDGINIAAPAGTPVLAAAAGTVAYAGNELRGYGNLILIKHAGGFITAYAHNSVLLVRRGEAVRRGEIIARIGATGAVAEPQLHFEIRQGTRSLDPSGYLPALSADAKN